MINVSCNCMATDKGQKSYFTEKLIDWHRTANIRTLPWKQEHDPYRIWLSEILLQQTRAQQGIPYYMRFVEAYPTIEDMAAANDEEAFRLWQGLGYYNRCKNMLATARYIVEELKGKFPDTYESLLLLKGVGAYTAAAIASFAYGLPYAVVDGNVYRVLARYFGIDVPFDTNEGKKEFHTLAQELLHTRDSGSYNQAIMDLGATVCTPQKPLCNECPLQKNCVAYRQGLVNMLPVRSKKVQVRKRYFHYIILRAKDKIWIQKRNDKDIWQNLHQFLLVEHTEPLRTEELMQHDVLKKVANEKSNVYEGKLTQRLTHQLIETHFYTVDLKQEANMPLNDGKWVPITTLKKYAFPKTVISFLEKKLYF